MSGTTTSIAIAWPPIFTDLSKAYAVAQLDLLAVFGIGCLAPVPYYSKLYMQFMGPLLILGAIFCLFLFRAHVLRPGLGVSLSQYRYELKNTHYAYVQSLLFLCYPGVSFVMIQAFNCRDVEGKWYLVADLSEVCYSEKWSGYAFLAMLGVCLYPIGILVYMGTILFRNRHKLWSAPMNSLGHSMKARYG